MTERPNVPPAVDPDNVPETLCIGRFNIAAGPGPLVTLTFTNVRNKASPLLDQSTVVQESVVRARVVTTRENLAALRDLLNTLAARGQSEPIEKSGGFTLN